MASHPLRLDVNRDRVALSKTISHALRHAPHQYGLEPDAEGWVPVPALIDALGRKRAVWRTLTEADLIRLNDEAEKQRFEIREGAIRALYGHSLPGKIDRPVETPPSVLYHGTPATALPAILREGLRPMRRQYVHLSEEHDTAVRVGARRAGRTVILEIDAAAAIEYGIRFRHGNEETWLADAIPPRFLTELDSRQ
jgi:putative RNA 2'-phosphotransferase